MLKPLDWLRQAWKSLKQRIFKPVVFFLDNATPDERRLIIEHIKPTLNGMNLDVVLSLPKLVVTNISRQGERLDYFLVRCSMVNPHFYNRDCYKNAIVYGESDYIGVVEDGAMTVAEFLKSLEPITNTNKIKIGEL